MGVKQTVQNKRQKCSEENATPPIFDLSLLAVQFKKIISRALREKKR